MDKLNPGGDESILKRLPRIIISGVRYEAALTSRRMVLAERETGIIREDIPYSSIALAVSGLNSIREPVLTISINTDDGGQRSIELIFVHQPGGMNIQNIESCMDILQDHQVAVQKIKSPNSAGPINRIQALTPGMQGGVKGQDRPAVPNMGLFSSFRSDRELPPEGSQKTPYLVAVAIIVVIIAVIAAGAFFAGQGPAAGVPDDHPDSAAPAVTNTPVITPPATMTIPATPDPKDSEPQVVLPQNGIWTKISSPGNYTGTLKAGGWETAINSTGNQLYQMPVQNTLIEGMIEKSDGTGNNMDVEIINGGVVVWSGATAKPYGIVDIHVPIGAAIISEPAATPVPTAVIAEPTPDTSLELVPVPPTGVWIRVAYPGDFTGTIRANGFGRKVSSSGVQLYQMSISSGTVESEFTKEDGTTKNLVVQLFKDGTQVTYGNTSRPGGVVEIQAMV